MAGSWIMVVDPRIFHSTQKLPRCVLRVPADARHHVWLLCELEDSGHLQLHLGPFPARRFSRLRSGHWLRDMGSRESPPTTVLPRRHRRTGPWTLVTRWI